MAIDENAQAKSGWLVSPDLRLRLLAALSRDPQLTPTMTYEEFLDWADEDTLAEWVDGKVVMASPASLKHQLLTKFLLRLLSGFAEAYALGTVVEAPFQMKLERSGREPDLVFVAAEHAQRWMPTYLNGPADLAVEVILPESAARDRGEKFYEYEAAGVPEYWLLDPQAERAEFYQLDEHGKYQQAVLDAEHIYRSRALPGFWLKTDWLWQDPLPAVEDTLLAVGGEPYARALIERLRRDGFLGAE
ncbi:MAG: Uma2 family endonuclease [Ktedonobacterales bacterium]